MERKLGYFWDSLICVQETATNACWHILERIDLRIQLDSCTVGLNQPSSDFGVR